MKNKKNTKKPSKALGIIGAYFLIHGILYAFGYLVATRFFIWENQWNFLFGNPAMFSVFIFLPIIMGLLYGVAAIGLLSHEHYGRILLLALCVQAIFFEFPVGAIISISILIYSFTPSFSKLFAPKTKNLPYRAGGMAVVALSALAILVYTGTMSSFIGFASHEVRGYDLSLAAATPGDKIVGIGQTVGPIDVLMELTDPNLDYASEQQDVLLSEIAQYVNYVINRFTVMNAVSANVDASDLLSIAENANVREITPLRPSARLFPYEVLDAAAEIANVTAALEADDLWAKGYTGRGVTVAIMDTGVDSSVFPVVGIFSVSGEEYVQEHGTMVASCVRAVAPEADLLNVNVFRITNGVLSATTDDILRGFEYVRDFAEQSPGPVILSCSWGISPADSWRDADIAAVSAGTLAVNHNIPVIAAAGNSGATAQIPHQIMSPSGGLNVIAVGATDTGGNITYFSSRGPYYVGTDKPDVVAPGMNVGVTTIGGGLTTVSGTSFACPYVSGVAALLLEEKDLSPEQLYTVLTGGARDLGPTGFDEMYGNGFVVASHSMILAQATLSEFNSTVLLIVLAVVGIVIMAYPAINRRLQKL